ncbi:Glucuronokinase 1 [Hondaea fermentalgiana]|uniref:Glucuronokinase 1 n=1 Tax=Hondaea fermentalgiana TaxID=2315210 RepID=A0A2R5G1G3_9STRA|nr:Glucuronokinase 1 [Hondaea fermentalgiana]|eukprot:GBG24365.1 Glucuronokinase 1 [Hondaea fermentalgiana]
MICVLLVAGVGNSLEEELLSDEKLRGIPRALLPVAGKPMLSWWWSSIMTTREIVSVYLVCNASNYKPFERWATANGLPASNVVNNGVTSAENALGAARDLELALRRATSDGISPKEVCVIAGDSLFFKEFDLPQVIACYRRLQKREESEQKRAADERSDNDAASSPRPRASSGGSQLFASRASLVLYYKLPPGEEASKRGIVSIDPVSKRVTDFVEKPSSATQRDAAQYACPLFYILGGDALTQLNEFCAESQHRPSYSCGSFLEFAHSSSNFYGLRLPGAFSLVGVSAGLREYRELDRCFGGSGIPNESSFHQDSAAHEKRDAHETTEATTPSSTHDVSDAATSVESALGSSSLSLPARSYGMAYARTGLLGNPSDGFFGKTLACTIKNFRAQVWLVESEKLCIKPHPLFDPSEFGSMNDLYSIALREGYHGGLRLLMATCKRFFQLCMENSIALPRRNFTVSYDTNIPRQVGLSGSSAIVTALLRALMLFYGLTDADIPKPLQPAFVLSVEMEEMGIQAGLQDRVVQCYEGVVYMDFSKDLMDRDGHGMYEVVPRSYIPDRFFIAYRADPSDSGKIHSNVKQRWLEGDTQVMEAMAKFASFAERGREALLSGDLDVFGDLMTQNFELRRALYSDAVVGQPNIDMVEIGRRHGCACKFPGSGGAILGLAPSRDVFAALRKDFEDNGCVFTVLELAP